MYNLLGVGPGIRYSINDILIGRLDWGIRCIETKNDGPPTRVHFSVIGNF